MHEFILCIEYRHNLIALYFTYPDAIHKQTVLVKMEVEIVCKDDIIEGLLIAVELLLVGFLTNKVGIVDVLCLDKENGQVVFCSGYDIVGCATLNVCRLIGYYHLGQQTMQIVL